MRYALTAAVFVAAASGIAAPTPSHAAPAPAQPCTRLDVADWPQASVDELRAEGWTSTPTDHTEALYAPTCTPEEVDTWPLGTIVEGVTYVLWPAVVQSGVEVAYVASYLESGWTLAPAGAGVDPDGTDHAPCLAQVGPTTLVECIDGWTTTS
jgi:hypothetical protein